MICSRCAPPETGFCPWIWLTGGPAPFTLMVLRSAPAGAGCEGFTRSINSTRREGDE